MLRKDIRVALQRDILAASRWPPIGRLLPLAVICLAGIVAIAGWSLPKGDAPVRHDDPAALTPDAGAAYSPIELSAPAKGPGNARSRFGCTECGIVESLRTIYRREAVIATCAVGESEVLRMPGPPFDVEGRSDLPGLAEMLAEVASGNQATTKIQMTKRYRIVVRLRDGSRYVIDDEAPRTLRVGERIQLIAAATASDD